MIKLDDFLTKKKEPAQVLDLSKIKITSKEEFKKYLEKIPECKVKPEKIVSEVSKIKDKDFSFYSGKKEEKQAREWTYPDPTPPDMKGAKLEDLCPVSIDWKMLTTLRPKTKVEEDMFSRLVQLGKLDLKHQQTIQKEKSTDWIRKTKNPKSSILEIRVLSCKECGEDFCDSSSCSKLMYDNFFRSQPTFGPVKNLALTSESKKKSTKKKRKKRKRKRPKKSSNKGRKKLGKNSIFNRPAGLGCSRDHSRAVEVTEKRRPRALSSTRSFSTEKSRTNFLEKRSKSAPRIHFKCDTLRSKTPRYDLTSDSGPSHTDYSSQSDSERPDFHRFFDSRLRLSGKRKLLSARVGFVNKNYRTSSTEGSRSRFIRKCTLYKDYHSDTSISDSHFYDEDDDKDNNTTSTESSLNPSRDSSKSPDRIVVKSAKYPSTIKIQFEEGFVAPALQFPEKIFLSNRNPLRIKEGSVMKKRNMIKSVKSFSHIDLQLQNNIEKDEELWVEKPKTGAHTHVSRSRETKLSKFAGPYVKARGLLKKNEK